MLFSPQRLVDHLVSPVELEIPTYQLERPLRDFARMTTLDSGPSKELADSIYRLGRYVALINRSRLRQYFEAGSPH